MKKYNRNLIGKISYIVIAILGPIVLMTGTLAVKDFYSMVALTNSFTALLLVAFSVVVYLYLEKKEKNVSRMGKILCGIFSFALSCALVIGKQLEIAENWNVAASMPYINILILSFYFYPLATYGMQYFSEKKNNVRETETTKQHFFVCWLLLFLCWLPVFLAFYPGAFVYDAQDEYMQVLTRNFSTHHPLVHVLLLGGLVQVGFKFLGSVNGGIALYTLLQMLIVSAVCSYCLQYVRKKLGTAWEKAAFLFFAFFPVIPMYAVCSAKDTLFTAALLLVVLSMEQAISAKKEEKCRNIKDGLEKENNNFKTRKRKEKSNVYLIILFLASVAMNILRNNGLYAYVVCFIILLFYTIFLKRNLRKPVIIMAAAICASILLSKGLTVLCHADTSENQEILTVPIQQLARTYQYSPEVFTESQIEILHEILPEEVLQHYTARCSDNVKYKFNNENYDKNPRKYQQLWWYGLKNKPVTYLNAWFLTSYGYWYPDAINNVYQGNGVFTFTYKDSSYFGFETEEPGVRQSKFPWLEEQYRRMSLELYQQKVPGLSMFFSPGFYFWIYVFAFFIFIYRKNWDKVLSWSLVLLVVATLLLGPTSLVRYVWIFWLGLPILAADIMTDTVNDE